MEYNKINRLPDVSDNSANLEEQKNFNKNVSDLENEIKELIIIGKQDESFSKLKELEILKEKGFEFKIREAKEEVIQKLKNFENLEKNQNINEIIKSVEKVLGQKFSVDLFSEIINSKEVHSVIEDSIKENPKRVYVLTELLDKGFVFPKSILESSEIKEKLIEDIKDIIQNRLELKSGFFNDYQYFNYDKYKSAVLVFGLPKEILDPMRLYFISHAPSSDRNFAGYLGVIKFAKELPDEYFFPESPNKDLLTNRGKQTLNYILNSSDVYYSEITKETIEAYRLEKKDIIDSLESFLKEKGIMDIIDRKNKITMYNGLEFPNRNFSEDFISFLKTSTQDLILKSDFDRAKKILDAFEI